MGEVTKRLAEGAIREGARIETGRAVTQILSEKNIINIINTCIRFIIWFFIHEKGESKVIGVVTQDGRKIIAKNVIVNADPFRMRDICYYLFHYKTKNVDKIKIL